MWQWTTTVRPNKIKTLIEELNAEKLLVKQRDEQLATFSQKMKSAVAKAVLTLAQTLAPTSLYLFCSFNASYDEELSP